MEKKKSIINKSKTLVPTEIIQRKIYLIRGRKVMVDDDLAALYGVETKVLIQAVKRNLRRFPLDFMFQLSKIEGQCLRSQIVTSNIGRGGRRYLPYVFTEQGVAMLSSILNSDRAIDVNIQIMRVFTKLREMMSSHKDLARKIEKLEERFKDHDEKFVLVFDAIRQLLAEPEEPKKEPMGFYVRREKDNQDTTKEKSMRKKRGFSLVELAIGLAVITVLVLAISFSGGIRDNARVQSAADSVQTLRSAAENYLALGKINYSGLTVATLITEKLLPANFSATKTNPWGGNFDVTEASGDANKFSVVLDGVDATSYARLTSIFKNNASTIAYDTTNKKITLTF